MLRNLPATLVAAALYGALPAAAANDALDVNTNTQNDKTAALGITTHGSDFYFAWCAVLGVTGISIMAAATKKPRTDRIFFYLTAAINFTAMAAYFTMGSNLGWTPIDVEFVHQWVGVNREIFYARYIDWFVTTPMLLLDLLLTGGIPWPTILWTIFLDIFMIITGLVGALVKTRYKWGFFVFSCAAMLWIMYIIGIEGRRTAKRLGADVHRVYLICGVWTLFIWLLYPICWALSEGGNVIHPDSEAVFYGLLDFCAKPVFSVMLLIGHWNIDPGRLGLRIRDFAYEPAGAEKTHPDGPLNEAEKSPRDGPAGDHGVVAP